MKKQITKELYDHAIKGKDGLGRDVLYIKEEYFNKLSDKLVNIKKQNKYGKLFYILTLIIAFATAIFSIYLFFK